MKCHDKPLSEGVTLKLKIILISVFLLVCGPVLSQIVHVTSSGAGTMDGSSWANALPGNSPGSSGYTRLADTLRHAVSGTAFWVAEGTYKPATDNDRNKSFEIIQNVSIFGGFGGTDTTMAQRNIGLHETVFSGNVGVDSLLTDNSYHVLITSGSTYWITTSLLDGLTVTGGYAEDPALPMSASQKYGAGLYSYQKLIIEHCTFKNNAAFRGGAGIFATDFGSNKPNLLTIKNSDFFYNTKVGSSGGAGILISYSYAVGTSQITGCRFSNNSGTAITTKGMVNITNCLIVNNSDRAVSCGSGTVNIKNSTIAQNQGGSVYVWSSTVSIVNSILWGGGGVTGVNPYTYSASYSCIEGGQTANGNINVNPLFVNPAIGTGTGYNGLLADYRPRWCSPVVGAGSNALIPPDLLTDLDGNPRIINGIVDMGAYENDTTGTNPAIVVFSFPRIYINDTTIYSGSGGSWEQALAGNAESCKYPGQTLLYEAMKDALPGTEVWITSGNYTTTLSGNRNHSFSIGNGVKVYGGFTGDETSVNQRNYLSNPTIFDGNINSYDLSTDNAYHVFNINPAGSAYSDSALLDGVVIRNGYAGGASPANEGGGLLINANTKLKGFNLIIENNSSGGNGGGIKINAMARVSLENCRVEHNSMILGYNGSYYYSASGCGIYNSGKLSIKNSQIRYNNEGKLGSGINNADSLVLFNCTVDSNRVILVRDVTGAGLYNSGFCSIRNSTVNHNKATLPGGGIFNNAGAVLWVSGSQVNANFSTATGGTQKGGGLSNDGTVNLTDSEVSYNFTKYDGGGIFNSPTGNCSVTGAVIAFNTASGGNITTGGGGICNLGILTVDRSKICNNLTSGSGGGIYNPTMIRNSLIANNTKGGQFATGGGLRIAEGCLGVVGSTIVNNSGQGIAASYISGSTMKEVFIPDTTDLKNSIVFGNDVQVSGYFSASNDCVEGGFAGLQVIRDHPVFVSPTSGKGSGFNALDADFSLKTCSPCVNVGNNAFLTASDTLDVADHPRVNESTVDLGALELTAPQSHAIDFTGNIVYVNDDTVPSNAGASWLLALPGNAPSCRYPGFSMLYEAIRDVPSTCSIWVKQGLYKAPVDNDLRKAFQHGSGLKLFGGFNGTEQLVTDRNISAHPTILSADIGVQGDSTDNACHVFYTLPQLQPWSDTALMDGITICDGYGNYHENNGLTDNLIGSGLFNNTNCVLKIRNCRIENNYAYGKYSGNYYIGYTGGSGVYNKGSLIINNSDISNNVNYRSGSGIFNENYIEMKNCTVAGNTLSVNGGQYSSEWGGAGIYGDVNSTINLDSCVIRENIINDEHFNAGGILCKGTLNLGHSKVFGNSLFAISCHGPANFSDCEIYGNGGGIASTAFLNVNKCSFTNNKLWPTLPLPSISAGSGALINDCEISYNRTGISSNGNTNITNCHIHHNNNGGFITYPNPGGWFSVVIIVQGKDGSGIIHLDDTLIVDHCDIHDNWAAGGCGVTIRGGVGFVNHSKIHHNVGDAGAAMRNYSQLTANNCLFFNNQSHRYGTFCNVWNSVTTLNNCTVINNSIDPNYIGRTFQHGAKYTLDTTGSPYINHFRVNNSIIKATLQPLSGYNSPVYSGADSLFFSCSNSVVSGISNINTDPQLVSPIALSDTTNPPASFYALSACSPCINAGADSLCADSLDLAGNRRKYNTIDMGALELKYDTTVTALWANNITEFRADIHWSRSVKPCETVVFIKDTTAGSPFPLTSAVYNADTVYGNGSNLAGWFCISLGLDSLTGVAGLLPSTTYRVAVFNRILDTIYDVPALMNFTTPGTLPPVKIVNSDTISQGETDCFNAGIELVVGGANSPFRIEEGGSVTLISGQKIRLLPGTTVESGGYLHAYIAPNGPWCYETKSTLTTFRTPHSTPRTPHSTPRTHFSVTAYPNPVTDLLTVSWTGEEVSQTGTTLILKNLSGKTVFRQVVNGVDNVTLSLRNLPRGLYFLSVENSSGSEVLKIIR